MILKEMGQLGHLNGDFQVCLCTGFKNYKSLQEQMSDLAFICPNCPIPFKINNLAIIHLPH